MWALIRKVTTNWQTFSTGPRQCPGALLGKLWCTSALLGDRPLLFLSQTLSRGCLVSVRVKEWDLLYVWHLCQCVQITLAATFYMSILPPRLGSCSEKDIHFNPWKSMVPVRVHLPKLWLCSSETSLTSWKKGFHIKVKSINLALIRPFKNTLLHKHMQNY